MPGASACAENLDTHLKGAMAGVDLMPIAERLDGASGAEIERVVRDARRLARRARRALTIEDLRAILPRQTRMSDELFRRTCVHEAGHVAVGLGLARRTGSVPSLATVSREFAGSSAASTQFIRIGGFDHTRDAYLAEIVVLLAGKPPKRSSSATAEPEAEVRTDATYSLRPSSPSSWRHRTDWVTAFCMRPIPKTGMSRACFRWTQNSRPQSGKPLPTVTSRPKVSFFAIYFFWSGSRPNSPAAASTVQVLTFLLPGRQPGFQTLPTASSRPRRTARKMGAVPMGYVWQRAMEGVRRRPERCRKRPEGMRNP